MSGQHSFFAPLVWPDRTQPLGLVEILIFYYSNGSEGQRRPIRRDTLALPRAIQRAPRCREGSRRLSKRHCRRPLVASKARATAPKLCCEELGGGGPHLLEAPAKPAVLAQVSAAAAACDCSHCSAHANQWGHANYAQTHTQAKAGRLVRAERKALIIIIQSATQSRSSGGQSEERERAHLRG